MNDPYSASAPPPTPPSTFAPVIAEPVMQTNYNTPLIYSAPPQQISYNYMYQAPLIPNYGVGVPVDLIPGQPGHLPIGRWSDNCTQCFDNCGICCLATFCPCFRWAQTLSRIGLMSYEKAFLIYIFFTAIASVFATLHFLTNSFWYWLALQAPLLCLVVVRTYYRTRIRAIYAIPGSEFEDFCCHLFCRECQISQEARHVDRDCGIAV